jgi:hypothetical protein
MTSFIRSLLASDVGKVACVGYLTQSGLGAGQVSETGDAYAVRATLASPQNGIHEAASTTALVNCRGDAGHFKEGNLPWIISHTGIAGRQTATALI